MSRLHCHFTKAIWLLHLCTFATQAYSKQHVSEYLAFSYFSLSYIAETSFWKQFTEATSPYISERNNTSFSVTWEVQTAML